jgi:hypothetical protein
MGDSNLLRIKRLSISKWGFVLMTKVVCWEIRDYVKGKLQVPKVWPIFTIIGLIRMEVASLEQVEFHLAKCALIDVHGGNLDVETFPFSKHDIKIVYHAPPRKDHDNKWLFGKNLIASVL